MRPKKRKEAKRSSFLVHAGANLLNPKRRSRGRSTSRTERPSLAGSRVMKTVNETNPSARNNHSIVIARVSSTTRISDHLRRLSLNGTGFVSDRLRSKRTPS
jgi:hypothetical protein